MLIAKGSDGAPCEATPGESAYCPGCGDPVIAKCGDVNAWHWAHKIREDCDPWSEPESAWHIDWKNHFPRSNQEVILPPHRADIRTDNRLVIELQHSAISPEVIREREKFYGNMVWVVDAEEFVQNFEIFPHRGYIAFRWKWMRRSWLAAEKQVLLDLRDEMFLFEIVKLNKKGTGYGHLLNKQELIESFRNGSYEPRKWQ